MKNKTYFLNTVLALVLGGILLVAMLLRTFVPLLIIPQLNIPNIVLISVVVLLLEHYLVTDIKRCYLCVFILSAITFGIMPLAAGFAALQEALKLTVAGGVVFTGVTWVFTSMNERITTGPAAKIAPVLSGFCLYLAVQCLQGIFL